MVFGKFFIYVKKYAIQKISELEKKLEVNLRFFISNVPYLVIITVISTIFTLLSSILFNSGLCLRSLMNIYLYILTILNTLSIVSLTGMNTAVQRASSRGYDGILKAGTKTRFKWSLIGSFIILAIAIYYFFLGNMLFLKCFLIGSLFFRFIPALDSFLYLLMGKMQFKKYTIYKIMMITIPTTVVLITLILSKNIFWTFFSYIALFSIIQVYLWRITVENEELNNEVDEESIKYGKNLTIQGIIPIIANQIDSIIIGNYFNFASLVIYSIAVYITSYADITQRNNFECSIPQDS